MEPSDEELCSRIAARDADAFELMVDRHQARAYRLAASILGNETDARDVSQDAFIQLYEAAGSFDGRSRFSTWFYRILVNLCIDNQRRNKWWRRLVPLASPGDDPEERGVDPPSSEPGPESVAMLAEIDKPVAAGACQTFAATARSSLAADAGRIHQPRNSCGAEVFGEYGACACASRDRAAQKAGEKLKERLNLETNYNDGLQSSRL